MEFPWARSSFCLTAGAAGEWTRSPCGADFHSRTSVPFLCNRISKSRYPDCTCLGKSHELSNDPVSALSAQYQARGNEPLCVLRAAGAVTRLGSSGLANFLGALIPHHFTALSGDFLLSIKTLHFQKIVSTFPFCIKR